MNRTKWDKKIVDWIIPVTAADHPPITTQTFAIGDHSGKDDEACNNLNLGKLVKQNNGTTIIDQEQVVDGQSQLHKQSLNHMDSTFLIDHLYVCLEGSKEFLDDDRGLQSIREPPDKGFHVFTDFWCDNWTEKGPLILRNSVMPTIFPKLSQLFVEGRWELGEVYQLMDDQLLQEIINVQLELSTREDKIIWQHSSDGKFTLKSAWNSIRSERHFNDQADAIWKQKDYGLTHYPLVIETNSKVLIAMDLKKSQASWHLWDLLDRIFSLLQSFSFQIKHTFREGNAVADSLANKGVIDGYSLAYIAADGLPMTTKQLILQDSRQIRIWAFRSIGIQGGGVYRYLEEFLAVGIHFAVRLQNGGALLCSSVLRLRLQIFMALIAGISFSLQNLQGFTATGYSPLFCMSLGSFSLNGAYYGRFLEYRLFISLSPLTFGFAELLSHWCRDSAAAFFSYAISKSHYSQLSQDFNSENVQFQQQHFQLDSPSCYH
ncbi:unnamed protein product [Ilex paraguariensis]|uniref:RNase H type-1 domain-containing protein n=1 Tax=Ilex paraguariensis TaxID=185542 RepID=A0ABC8TPJ0_9AQUA